VAGAQSAIAAGFPTLGNLLFVAPSERAERARALRNAGVAAILESWHELEGLLTHVAAPGR
jgi:hypothetical protein